MPVQPCVHGSRFFGSWFKEIAMLEGVSESGTVINWRRVVMAAVAGTVALGAASIARADDDDHHWKKRRYYYAPYYVAVPQYYAPPPVVYAPPPVVVYPQPMVYAPAYPSYYGPPGGSLNFGVTVPLR
jgi:hypothetical protein